MKSEGNTIRMKHATHEMQNKSSIFYGLYLSHYYIPHASLGHKKCSLVDDFKKPT